MWEKNVSYWSYWSWLEENSFHFVHKRQCIGGTVGAYWSWLYHINIFCELIFGNQVPTAIFVNGLLAPYMPSYIYK